LTEVGFADRRDDQQDEERSEAHGGAYVEDAKTAASISGSGANLWGHADEEVGDRESAEDVLNGVDLKQVGGEPALGGEVIGVAVVGEKVEWKEDGDGDDEEPLDPGDADINRRPLGKVDAEGHQTQGPSLSGRARTRTWRWASEGCRAEDGNEEERQSMRGRRG